ncbi:MAG: ABC transporter permease subunit [Planctomycetes bacterium]|nr:ABC transporter permease subunit [Planctomycetota bacterium]
MSDGMFTGLRPRDLGVVGSTWFRFAMRSGGGVVALFIVVVAGLWLTAFVFSKAEPLLRIEARADESPERQQQRVDAAVGLLVKSQLQGSIPEGEMEAAVELLTRERPAVLSGILLLLLVIVPFAACSAAFNQTASDIGSKGLRFLLSRTERPNIFVGRFLAAAGFLGLALALLVAALTLYIGIRFPFYGKVTLLSAAIEGWWILFVFGLPFVALCSWLSSTQRTPFAALALCYVVSLLPWWILAFLVGAMKSLDTDLEWLNRLTPWGWRMQLTAPGFLPRLASHGAMLGFTALFLVLGLLNFRKRDL